LVERRLQRVTLREAADILGVSKEAVRKRTLRGTLRSEKGGDGRVYVYLDFGGDKVGDDAPTGEPDALISQMQGRIEDLRSQLEAERQAHAEARRIIAGLVERIPPAIEPPSEARESPETVEAEQELDTEQARHEMAESTLREGMDEERWRREEAERERDELRRELYALRQQRESPQKAEEASEGREPRSYAPGAQEGVQRRPWWRRVFGG